MVKFFKRKKKELDVPVPPSRRQKMPGAELPEISKTPVPLPQSRTLPPAPGFKEPLPPPRAAPAPLPPSRHLPPALALKEPPKGIILKLEERGSIRELESKAPLFIKIDKYREIVKDIQRLKSYSLTLRDALDALSDMERELRTGLDLTTKALDRFNSVIAILDSKFLRFQSIGPEERQKMERSSEEIEDYVKDLYVQMEKIRHELRTISP